MIRTDDILASRYKIGGRELGRFLDCYGVVKTLAERRGTPIPDWWQQLRRSWLDGRLDTSGFGDGWHRVDCPLSEVRDGDVLILQGRHQGVAIVHAGHVWTSNETMGPYARALCRWSQLPAEVWRHD